MTGLSAKLVALPAAIEAMHATENSPAFANSRQDKNLARQLDDFNRMVGVGLAHISDITKPTAESSFGAPRPVLKQKTSGRSHEGELEISGAR